LFLLGHDQGSLTFGFNWKIRTFFGRNVYQMSATVSDPKALVVSCTSRSETILGLFSLHVAWVDYVACWRAGQTTVSWQFGLARQVVCKANSRPDCIKFGIRPKSKERKSSHGRHGQSEPWNHCIVEHGRGGAASRIFVKDYVYIMVREKWAINLLVSASPTMTQDKPNVWGPQKVCCIKKMVAHEDDLARLLQASFAA
jgi:hypothetical protein